MKNVLKIEEMMSYLPSKMKEAISSTAKDCGIKVDDLELHRHSHSEKSKTNQLEPEKRQSLSYVSVRTQDRDDEIVIPEALDLKSFLSYRHVLVNHNYSLLPIGSDEHIEADSWGLKALTNHADTGPGTLANVIWSLVSQGHMNAKSVGFVPTSYTKPGARDWDRVANQLSQNWKEFDKGRAEKSISRIITGGVLLEHSFVSVPANSDSVVVGIVKSMNLDGKIIKQLGWEMKDGIIVNKAAAPDPVSCVCDECGYVADAVPGSKCPECKTGDMKPKGKEKAIEIREVSKGMGTLSSEDLRQSLQQLVMPKPSSDMNANNCWVNDIFEDHFIFNKDGELFSQGYAVVENKPQLVGEPVKVERRTSYVRVVGKGGPGSGNFGHSGRPGEVGGSGEGDGGSSDRGKHQSERLPMFATRNDTDKWVVMADGLHQKFDSKQEAEQVFHKLLGPSGNIEDTAHGSLDILKPNYEPKYQGDYKPEKVGSISTAPEVDLLRYSKVSNERLHERVRQQEMAESQKPASERYARARSIAEFFGGSARDIYLGKKGFHSHAVEKPNPHMPGGSFSACVLLMEDKGHDNESAKKICGALQAESGEKIYDTIAEEVINKEVTGKAYYASCVCSECGAEADTNPGESCEEEGCKGTMQAKKEKKEYTPEITVVKPAPQIKVLYVPPDADLIAKGVSEAVERALSRKTGRIV